MSKAYDEMMSFIPKKKYEKEDSFEDKDEMVGHSTNRRLNEPWNIKMRFTAENFDDTFRFLRELGYDTLFRFNKKGLKIFKLNTSAPTHFSYVIVDRTEMSEYSIDWEKSLTSLTTDTNTSNTNLKTKTKTYTEETDDQNDSNDNETDPITEDDNFQHETSNRDNIQEANSNQDDSNQDENNNNDNNDDDEEKYPKEDEIIAYTETDIIEDISLNNKYPVDIYFDTIEKNKYYIVNGKEIVSRRLNGLENDNNTVNMYFKYYYKLMNWMADEDTIKLSVTSKGMENVLKSLEKKKPKKDKTAGSSGSAFVEVKFSRNEIDFIIQNEIKSSSIQLYGDDIIVKCKSSTEAVYDLESLIKFGKLKLTDNVTFYINENFPLVLETRYGANKYFVFYAVAPRKEEY